MNTIENIKRYNYLSQIINIKTSDVNEDGIYTVCSILNDLIAINDRAIIYATGELDYSSISIASYQIEFAEKVFAGDTLLFESNVVFSNNTMLEIATQVRKKKKGKTVIVSTGNFIINLVNENVLITA